MICGNYISGWINWVPDSYQTIKSKKVQNFGFAPNDNYFGFTQKKRQNQVLDKVENLSFIT